jgi:hypothetical protein
MDKDQRIFLLAVANVVVMDLVVFKLCPPTIWRFLLALQDYGESEDHRQEQNNSYFHLLLLEKLVS